LGYRDGVSHIQNGGLGARLPENFSKFNVEISAFLYILEDDNPFSFKVCIVVDLEKSGGGGSSPRVPCAYAITRVQSVSIRS